MATSPARQAAAAATSAIATHTDGGIAGLAVCGIIHIKSGCEAAATTMTMATVLISTGVDVRASPPASLRIAPLNEDECHPDAAACLAAAQARAGLLDANDART